MDRRGFRQACHARVGELNDDPTRVGADIGATNEAVVFSLRGSAPEGMIFYGVRVKSAGVVVLAVCNFTGGTSPTITDLPIRVITFG